MVTPGKCSLTKMTLEGFAARVFPEMSRQFIRAGKPPVTVGPGAGVGLLPCVGSLVGLQVGRLRVNLKYGDSYQRKTKEGNIFLKELFL